MRLDVWLHRVCLLKSRNQAKQGCQSGHILLDGQPVKESRELRGDEELTLRFPRRELRVRVLAIPTGNLAKRDAAACYALLEERALRDEI
ncbi:RNA-binding S4 domain-containing protein [bacterium]|nr:RNA-binding S4 domain-containing protein [bacterium]